MNTADDDQFAPRLDRIETAWSVMRRAHEGTAASAAEARRVLVMTYSSSIRSYIRAMTASEDEADELAQDVVVRLLRGDFAGADPERGRFRDLLKVAVRNMVRNHWERQNRRRGANIDVGELDVADQDAAVDSDPWLDGWRNNVLEVAWSRLEDHQRQTSGSVAYTLLKLRAENPSDSSSQLADKLSAVTGRPFRPDATRQQLHRARLRFAELLVEEVADALDEPTPERLQDELIALGLYDHIKDVLPKEWKIG